MVVGGEAWTGRKSDCSSQRFKVTVLSADIPGLWVRWTGRAGKAIPYQSAGSENYHVVGCKWNPETIEFYVDGKHVGAHACRGLCPGRLACRDATDLFRGKGLSRHEPGSHIGFFGFLPRLRDLD